MIPLGMVCLCLSRTGENNNIFQFNSSYFLWQFLSSRLFLGLRAGVFHLLPFEQVMDPCAEGGVFSCLSGWIICRSGVNSSHKLSPTCFVVCFVLLLIFLQRYLWSLIVKLITSAYSFLFYESVINLIFSMKTNKGILYIGSIVPNKVHQNIT